jgi:hypothetical protein
MKTTSENWKAANGGKRDCSKIAGVKTPYAERPFLPRLVAITHNSQARQAIFTKYLPATNVRGGRIKAYCERGSITTPYPDELSGEASYAYAVELLLAKFKAEDLNEKSFGCLSEYVIGASPTAEKSSFVFVRIV